MDIVNERSNWTSKVSFIDQDRNPVTPDSASYRIDDVGSLTEIRSETPLEVEATEIDIKWESTDTAILDKSHPFELRRMTVSWQYLDDNDELQDGNEQYLLHVRNLPGVPEPDALTT